MTKNIILLQKRLVNLLDANANNLQLAMSVQHELMDHGFMLDQSAFDIVKRADSADIIEFHKNVISYLKEMTGGKHNFQSLYKNFPIDVMSMTQAELWINQIIHYWTACEFMPVGVPKEKAFEAIEYKILTSTDEEGFLKIFTDLCSVGNSLTPQDQKVLQWFINNNDTLIFPDKIPFKENLCLILSECFKTNREIIFQ